MGGVDVRYVFPVQWHACLIVRVIVCVGLSLFVLYLYIRAGVHEYSAVISLLEIPAP